MKTSALDVAANILSRAKTPTVDGLVILKLVYYSQAWHLAWYGKPLFDERIEAWQHGPVVPNVWRFGGVKGYQISRVVGGKKEGVSQHAGAVLASVIDFYGAMNGPRLSELTHTERPWQEARIGLRDDQRGNTVITPASIRRFHTAQVLRGEPTPQRPVTPSPQHQAPLVSDVAQFQERHWSKTLDWLSTR